MAEIVDTDEEGLNLRLNYQEAGLIKLLIGKFASKHAGGLEKIWQELDDYGVEELEGIGLLSQSEPMLYLVATQQEQ